MKLSKKAKKQLETINKAYDGSSACMKMQEKRGSKMLEKLKTVRYDNCKAYVDMVKDITKFIDECNYFIGIKRTRLDDIKVASKRFKYMSYNEMCQLGLKQDDIKAIRQRLNTITDGYKKMIHHMNKVQFDTIRETLDIINDDIMINLNSDFYECKVRMFRRPLVDVDWYLNDSMICSTEKRPYYGNCSSLEYFTEDSAIEPAPSPSRDLDKKQDSAATPTDKPNTKSFMDALIGCEALPFDVPEEIVGVFKQKEINKNISDVKERPDEKTFHISEDKKE